MYLCVCILRASLRCSKWLIEPEREQYFVLSHPLAPLWAQVCSQPWFLLPGNSQCCKRPCRGRGAGWGYRGGLFQLTAWVGASSYLWGALSMHAAKVHVPQNGQKRPNSWFLQTARPTANAVREKPLQKWISFFPFSLRIPSVRRWDMQWPEGPVPAQAVPEERWQHRDVLRPLRHRFWMPLRWGSTGARGKWSADLSWKASVS